jgi:hypothetical protein
MSRPLQEADGWGYFRVDDFKFRLKPLEGGGGSHVFAAFSPIQDSLPATTSIGELMNCISLTPIMTMPTEWCSVRKTDLRGLFPWYKAVNGTFDTTEEAPGILRLLGPAAATDQIVVEAYCTMTFKTGISAANTPKVFELTRQKHRLLVEEAKEKERVQFMRVLGAVGSPLVLVERTTSEPSAGRVVPTSSQISQQP